MKREINREPPDDTTVPVEMTVREAGQRGGRATRERHGVEFYRQIGARGGETTKRRWGHLFSQFGKKGGRPRRPNLENSLGEEFLQMKEVESAVGPGNSSPP